MAAVITASGNTMRIAPHTMQFCGRDSTLAGEVICWNWMVLDSSGNVVLNDQGITVSKKFVQADTYTVYLSIKDDLGNTSITSTTFVISAFTGQTKYVDFTGGNDANSGDDDTHAWKTLQYALTHANWSTPPTQNNPGKILLKKGETWALTAILTISGTVGPFIFDNYGTGAKPLITFDAAGKYIDIQAVSGDPWGYGIEFNHINITSSTATRTHAEAIKISRKGCIVRDMILTKCGINANGQLSGLCVEDSTIKTGTIGLNVSGDFIKVRNTTFQFIGTDINNTAMLTVSGIASGAGNISNHIDCSDNTFDGTSGGHFAATFFRNARAINIRRCSVTKSRNGICVGSSDIAGQDTVASNDIWITKCTSYDNGDNTFTGKNTQISAYAFCWVDKLKIINCVSRNNVHAGSTANAVLWGFNTNSGSSIILPTTATVKIYGFTSFEDQIPFYFGAAQNQNVTLKGNVQYLTTVTPGTPYGRYRWTNNTIRDAITSDYNAFYWTSHLLTTDNVNDAASTTPNSTWGTWTGLGKDAHSTIGNNPTFTNTASSPPDLTLQSSSPVLNVGTTLPELSDDFNGMLRYFNNDLGAYQYFNAASFSFHTAARGLATSLRSVHGRLHENSCGIS